MVVLQGRFWEGLFGVVVLVLVGLEEVFSLFVDVGAFRFIR